MKELSGIINGAIIRTYLGLAFVNDANEAENLLLLIGCKELKALNGFKAIIGGFFFFLGHSMMTSLFFLSFYNGKSFIAWGPL